MKLKKKKSHCSRRHPLPNLLPIISSLLSSSLLPPILLTIADPCSASQPYPRHRPPSIQIRLRHRDPTCASFSRRPLHQTPHEHYLFAPPMASLEPPIAVASSVTALPLVGRPDRDEVVCGHGPRMAKNFRALCTREKGIGRSGKPLHYKGSAGVHPLHLPRSVDALHGNIDALFSGDGVVIFSMSDGRRKPMPSDASFPAMTLAFSVTPPLFPPPAR